MCGGVLLEFGVASPVCSNKWLEILVDQTVLAFFLGLRTFRSCFYGSFLPPPQWEFQGPPRTWDPLMVSFSYYSHTIPIRIPKDMGMVWEDYHKGVPLLGVPGITLDLQLLFYNVAYFGFISSTSPFYKFYPTGYPPIHIHTHISIFESKIDLLISRVPLDSSSFISIFGSHRRKLWPSEGIATIVTFNMGVEAAGPAELIADRLHLKARNSGIEDMKTGIMSREREPVVLLCS